MAKKPKDTAQSWSRSTRHRLDCKERKKLLLMQFDEIILTGKTEDASRR